VARLPVVYSPQHQLHRPPREVDFGQPQASLESPARIELIRATLAREPGVTFAGPTRHGLAPLEAVHDPGLIRYLAHAWAAWRGATDAPDMVPDTVLHPALRAGMGPAPEPRGAVARLGYWTYETATPLDRGTYVAARVAVDVALTAADQVLAGAPLVYGLCRPPGHHAPHAAYGGYCYFNNAAIVAAEVVRRTGTPVAVLDLDYHHGNGTQQIFYARDDVTYVSLHGDPAFAYPYFAGFAEESGTGRGRGLTLNLPLPPGTTDQAYLEALDRALEHIARFGSSIVVVSLGLDTAGSDPLGDFALTPAVYALVGAQVAALGLRLIVLQEGGYDLPRLGPLARAWLRGARGQAADDPALQ
jgi:acetoin utilization deacetylase AcuC-like enzyme